MIFVTTVFYLLYPPLHTYLTFFLVLTFLSSSFIWSIKWHEHTTCVFGFKKIPFPYNTHTHTNLYSSQNQTIKTNEKKKQNFFQQLVSHLYVFLVLLNFLFKWKDNKQILQSTYHHLPYCVYIVTVCRLIIFHTVVVFSFSLSLFHSRYFIYIYYKIPRVAIIRYPLIAFNK